MRTAYVALSAVFFGLVGPFVNVIGTNPVVGALLASLVSGAVHGTTTVANLARCKDVRLVPSWAVLTAGWLFATMRVALFVGYVLLPVSLALPLFYTWVPAAAVADWILTTKGDQSYRGNTQGGRDLALRLALTVTGAAVLIVSDRFEGRSMWAVIGGVGLVLLAAAATAARVIVTKYHLLTLSATDRVASSNWLIATVAAVLFLHHPPVLKGLDATTVLAWVAFGLGLFVANANFMNELENLTVSEVSFALLLELFVAVLVGLLLLGEHRNARMLAVGGVRVPAAKLLGLAAIAVAVVEA